MRESVSSNGISATNSQLQPKDSLVFSESVRKVAAENDLGTVLGYHTFYSQEQGDNPMAFPSGQISALLTQLHLTTGTRERFVHPATGIACAEASVFLSKTEVDEFYDYLIREIKKEQMNSLARQIEEMRSGAEMIAFGFPAELTGSADSKSAGDGAAGASAWVVGALVYKEPKDRLVGPEHQDMTPYEFIQEFDERGGEAWIMEPHEALAAQFTVATRFIRQKAVEEAPKKEEPATSSDENASASTSDADSPIYTDV